MKHLRGFTVIEVLVVLLFLITAATLFYSQAASVNAAARDTERKVSLNAMYYNLEEVFYERAGHYPQNIDSRTLRAMDPELFNDPDGHTVNEPESTIQYEGTDCSLDGQCNRYTLTAHLENEDDFIRNSRRN